MKKIIDNITFDNSLRVLVYPFKNIIHVAITGLFKFENTRTLMRFMLYMHAWLMVDNLHVPLFWNIGYSHTMGVLIVIYNTCQKFLLTFIY